MSSSRPPERRQDIPIALYYFALLAATGAFYPYFALYLTSVGLSTTAATRVLAILPFTALFVPPLLGLLADARSARIWLLRGLTLGTAVAFAAFQLAAGHVVAVVVIATCFGALRSPLAALADATAFEHVRTRGGSYGALRLWGSLGFLLAALGGGLLIEAVGLASVVWTTTGLLALAAACAWGMPAPPLERHPEALGAWGAMLRRPSLWLFLVSIVLAQTAASIYDSAFAIHLSRQGHGGGFIGVALAIGVAVEIALLARSGRLLAAVGAERALAAAVAIAAARWYALAYLTSSAALLLLQPLHAITFGLYWVASTALAREYAGPQAVAAGQGLLAAVMGIGSVLGNGLAGEILERYGSGTLWRFAAVVAAVGALGSTLHAVLLRARPAPLASATARRG